jgi:hypothetical protein
MGQSAGSVAQGLFGYNASLTSAAIFGMFYAPSASSGLVAVAAAATATVGVDTVGVLLLPYGLPVATLPFCFTATLLVLIQGTTAALIAVPLETMTIPEDHWARLAILRRMFSFLKATLDQHCAHTPEFLRYFRCAADRSAAQEALGRAAQLHARDGRVRADDIHGTLVRADPGADPAVIDLLLCKVRRAALCPSPPRAPGMSPAGAGPAGEGRQRPAAPARGRFRPAAGRARLCESPALGPGCARARSARAAHPPPPHQYAPGQGCGKQGADLGELGAMLGLARSASVLRRDVEAFFAVVDADGSGGLSLAELEAVQRYLGAQVGEPAPGSSSRPGPA